MISFEIIQELGEIKEYDAQWDELFDSGEYEPSLSLGWGHALLKTHLGGDTFFLIVLKDSSEILGIVPLCIRKVKKYGLTLLTLFPLAEYFNTHSDLLLKTSSKEIVDVFLKALFSAKYKWDVFRINRFIDNNHLLNRISQSLRNNFTFHFDIQTAEPSFFIELGSSYDDFLRKRTANFRYKIKNVAKKMHSMGEVAFLRNHDFSDFDKPYRIILQIEENSWKHKHGTAITSSEKQREFYRELGKNAFMKGWLRLCILCLDCEPIAFEMGLARGGKYFGVHGSYNEKFRNANPGTMLFAQFISDLIHEGIREYDWFGEPFEFQSRWTDTYRWHKSLLIYNNTAKANVFYIYNTIRNKMNKNVEQQLVLRDPRDIRPNKN